MQAHSTLLFGSRLRWLVPPLLTVTACSTASIPVTELPSLEAQMAASYTGPYIVRAEDGRDRHLGQVAKVTLVRSSGKPMTVPRLAQATLSPDGSSLLLELPSEPVRRIPLSTITRIEVVHTSRAVVRDRAVGIPLLVTGAPLVPLSVLVLEASSDCGKNNDWVLDPGVCYGFGVAFLVLHLGLTIPGLVLVTRDSTMRSSNRVSAGASSWSVQVAGLGRGPPPAQRSLTIGPLGIFGMF